jgi:Putative Actinobacterial Holin-X, holin superfamily III
MSLVMAGWLAALIVGGVLTVVAGILVGAGTAKLKRANLLPDKTIRTLEEDAQWAKQQIK